MHRNKAIHSADEIKKRTAIHIRHMPMDKETKKIR